MPLKRTKRFLIAICLIVFLLIVGGGLFVKFNTVAAAEITDTYLRPWLGNTNVLYLEQWYFNLSDMLDQITHKGKPAKGPTFLDQNNLSSLDIPNNLHLRAIPPNPNFQALPNEGVWHDKPLKLFPGKEVMAYTFIRPDNDRSFANVTIVAIDTKAINLGSVAGTKEPGSMAGNPGPGKVPADIINSGKLVAAFDGGFQYRDGQYGMIVGDKTYLPLKPNLGTLVGYKNGSLKIINYTGQDLGKDVAFVRQNCPILIDNGILTAENPTSSKIWGRTVTDNMYTWRSGIGLTPEGNLLYAVGNNLTPLTLSYALKIAGAENAMQLDINANWVRFNIFNPTSTGSYTSATLTQDLRDGTKQYLNGYKKDFFYLYQK